MPSAVEKIPFKRGLPRKHRLTVNDYYRMAEAGILGPEDRVELIKGEVFDMVLASCLHAASVNRIGHVAQQVLADYAIVSNKHPLRLDRFSEPVPDLMLLKPRDDFYASGHPGPDDVLLLIEVADTTLKYDRGVKIPLYAAHGVLEVWLVDLEGRRLYIHREPAGKIYRRIETPPALDSVSPAALPTISLDLRALF